MKTSNLKIIQNILILYIICIFQKLNCITLPKPSVCTNFKQVHSPSEYIKEFKLSNCPPIIVLPGLMGSNLRALIDCSIFLKNKEKYFQIKNILSSCPFLCKNKTDIFDKSIWVNNKSFLYYLTMNEYNLVYKNKQCLINIFQVYRQKNPESSEFSTIDLPGFEIRIHGDTPKSSNESDCGANAIESIESNSDRLYKVFLDTLRDQGYVSGISLQVVPYDFRHSSLINFSSKKIKLSLKIQNALLNKKSVLVGHSYGNNQIQNFLKTISKQEKDTLIQEYFSLSPSFMGSPKTIFYSLNTPTFLYFKLIYKYTRCYWLNSFADGMDAQLSSQFFPSLDMVYELMHHHKALDREFKNFKNNWNTMKNSKLFSDSFLENVLENITHYAQDELIIKKFGSSSESTSYTLKDLNLILDKFSSNPLSKSYFESFPFDKVDASVNPEVPVRIFFISGIKTMGQLIFKNDPKKEIKKNKFANFKYNHHDGDDTVPLFSLVLPPLNWLSEYIQKEDGQSNANPNAEPVKFIHFGDFEHKSISKYYIKEKCDDNQTIKKNWLSYFKTEDIDGESLTSKLENTNYGKLSCNHSNIITNSSFLNIFLKHLMDVKSEIIHSKSLGELDNKGLQKMYDQCYPVTCKHDFDLCYDQFLKLVFV